MRQASAWSRDDEDGDLFGGRLFETIDVELARALAKDGGLGLAAVLMPTLSESGGDAAERSAATEPIPPRTAFPAHGASTPTVEATNIVASPNPTVVPEMLTRDPVSSGYGWRGDPIDGETRFHAGVDLRAAYGHEVAAAQSGTVVHAGSHGDYGLSVVIEHRPGVQTRYAHLSSILVEVGERVEARQVIGRIGRTGRATGAHLHFELSYDGQPVDPISAEGGVDGLLKKLRLVADLPNDRSRIARLDRGAEHHED